MERPGKLTVPGTEIGLTIAELQAAFASGALTPVSLIEALWPRLSEPRWSTVWIRLLDREELLAHARELEARGPHGLPLYGIPFAIKDNIDLANVPTTAACPAYTYVPQRDAVVVEKLIAAGAMPIGKTNLDQFATGLVGVRSPYGIPENPYGSEWIPGGSSSGSAVAVSAGLVSFALGTDTAGSGRVPAAFNNLVGLVPTCGLLSTTGVVPACRSLDCVTVFTQNVDDAELTIGLAAGYDEADPYSRKANGHARGRGTGAGFVFAVPRDEQLEFFGNDEAGRLFREAVARLESIGGEKRKIDYSAFRRAAQMLYAGPWVAERYLVAREFVDSNSMHPVTREIIAAGAKPTAAEGFSAQYKLAALKRETERIFASGIDLLVTPTAGTIYKIGELLADPIRLNSNLGHYTNHLHLVDLCALAVPAGFQQDGAPFGITLAAPAFHDRVVAEVGRRYETALLGTQPGEPRPLAPGEIAVAVCGAHMEGLPLNPQLIACGGRLLNRMLSAPLYKFYALPGGPPKRPGMIRVRENGRAVPLEVWAVDANRFGAFVAAIPAPLGIGKVKLEDGSEVSGFICETAAIEGAEEIPAPDGWREYVASLAAK